MQFCFRIDKCYSCSNIAVVLGVRESNLYRLKGQPMQAMDNKNKVTKDME
jgi:hypothetical protein